MIDCKEGFRCGSMACEVCSKDFPGGEIDLKAHASLMAAPAGKCIHLGITVANLGGCRTTYECERGHGNVRPCVECRSCEDFSPDDVV